MPGKIPAFQFYPKDFLVDTDHLTLEEIGAYVRLLCYAWIGVAGCRPGTIPSSKGTLSKLARVDHVEWDKIAPAVMSFFDEKGDTFVHRRIMKDIEKYTKYREMASKHGKNGSSKRWGTPKG